MATLLNQKLLKSCVEKFNFPENQKRQRIDEIISAWQTAFKDHDLSKAKETSLQGKFFSKFFCEILGYTMQDDGQEVWTLKQEAKTEVDGKEADGSLGYYSKTSAKTRCVIELKDAQCNLDSKSCLIFLFVPLRDSFAKKGKINYDRQKQNNQNCSF